MAWIPSQILRREGICSGHLFGWTEEIGQSDMKKRLFGVVFSII
jgi:hypothetical protein